MTTAVKPRKKTIRQLKALWKATRFPDAFAIVAHQHKVFACNYFWFDIPEAEMGHFPEPVASNYEKLGYTAKGIIEAVVSHKNHFWAQWNESKVEWIRPKNDPYVSNLNDLVQTYAHLEKVDKYGSMMWAAGEVRLNTAFVAEILRRYPEAQPYRTFDDGPVMFVEGNTRIVGGVMPLCVE